MMGLNDHGETTADIMAEFKNKKFAIVDADLGFESPMVVLSDLLYWTGKWDEVQSWCNEHACKIDGTVVTMPDEKTLMLFCLKWS